MQSGCNCAGWPMPPSLAGPAVYYTRGAGYTSPPILPAPDDDARMTKGLFTALAIMLACAVIPVAQVLLAPFGPFLGGYYGIRWVDTQGQGALAAAARFGGVIGAASALILAAIAVILMLSLAMPQRFIILTWIAVAVFALYVAMMSTLGGLYRLMKMQMTTAAADAEPAEAG